MTIEFQDRDNEYIKQWPNWDGPIPMKGDYVLLHFGDNNEEEAQYIVLGRSISGLESDKLYLQIGKV